MKYLMILKVVIVFILLILSIYDIRYKKIPVLIPFGYGILNLVIRLLCGKVFWDFFFSGFVIFLFFLFINKITRGQIGSGDAFVFFMLATELGFLKSIGLIYISFFLAFIAAVFFFFIRKKGKGYEIPFVPLISLAYMMLVYCPVCF